MTGLRGLPIKRFFAPVFEIEQPASFSHLERRYSMDKKVVIPETILKEFVKDRRIVLADETRGLWPLPIDLLKNEAFIKSILNDKELLENYEVALITKTR